MKRSPRLQSLSREHHKALVLAKRIARADLSESSELADMVQQFLIDELEPHFLVEEQALLPELTRLGVEALVQRTLDEHRDLRRYAAEVRKHELASLEKFGTLLAEHVRFEERTLFPLAEQILESEWLSRD